MFPADDNLELNCLFTEPPRPPTPESTFVTYVRPEGNLDDSDNWREIRIKLVGSHPLWGHYLWNSSLALASYLDSNRTTFSNKFVLELGAGGGLPSIVAAINGAGKVVITDYPDRPLMDNILFNVSKNIKKEYLQRVDIQGYIWGHSVEGLLAPLNGENFDFIILSDLIFNHSQHDALIETCNRVLSHNNLPAIKPSVLVFYTHHRPHLAHKDMEFFAKARKKGWNCEQILEQTFAPMFPDDPGEESIRSTVHGWRMARQASTLSLSMKKDHMS